jgi:hypothetical protein
MGAHVSDVETPFGLSLSQPSRAIRLVRCEREKLASEPRRKNAHPDRQREGAQPQEPQRRHPAQQVQRDHRRVGLGQVHARFDILFNEGQRRYLESLNAYARSIVQPAGRPEVDAVYGIPPTVAIEQRLSRGGRKSTVGTTTEVWHFLRLLYVKLGVQHCVHDGAEVRPQTPDSIVAQIMKRYRASTWACWRRWW